MQVKDPSEAVVSRLYLQFRIERMVRRLGWVMVALVIVLTICALIPPVFRFAPIPH